MRLFWDNQIDYAAASVIDWSSQNVSFPAANVVDELKTNLWRTDITAALEYVTFDLGSAKSVTSIIIFAHTLLNTDTLIKVMANTAPAWGAPPFSQNLTWSAGPIIQTFSAQVFRYWRFTFTKAAAGVTRDVGRIFLGPFYDTSIEPDYDGYKRGADDLTQRQRSEAGQNFSFIKPIIRKPRVDFTDVPQTMLDQLVAFQTYVGLGRSFFEQVKPSGTGELAELMYVKMAKPFEAPVEGFDADYFYNVTLDMEEQL